MIKEAGSSGYTDGELLRMQQDAIARVKEMQERAKANVTAQEGWQGTGAAAPGEEPAAAPAGPSQETAAPPTGQAGPSGPPLIPSWKASAKPGKSTCSKNHRSISRLT